MERKSAVLSSTSISAREFAMKEENFSYCVENLKVALGCVCYMRYVGVMIPFEQSTTYAICERAYMMKLQDMGLRFCKNENGQVTVEEALNEVEKVLGICTGGSLEGQISVGAEEISRPAIL